MVGVSVDKGHLWLFPSGRAFMIKVPFDPNGKTRHQAFGKPDEQVRIQLESPMNLGEWRGMYAMGDQLVLWDSSMLQLMVIRMKDFGVVRKQTVPMDVLRPVRDRGGEATKQEISDLRKRFHTSFLKTKGLRFSGVAEIPPEWEKNPGRSFLISTRIRHFPLLLMACAQDDGATCYIARSCSMSGASSDLGVNSAGVAINASAQEVLVANSMTNTIETFDFKSCAKIVKKSELRLPKNFPKIEAIHVDSSDRLWITTGIMDSPIDANVFYWDKSEWK